ncbi:MAG: hypothetical protein NVSMB70_04330 [Chamaesiphon sp.]
MAGLYEVHQRYGKLSWPEVVAPAIKLAKNGFVVSDLFVQSAQARKQAILNNPATRQVFTKNGVPYAPGDRLVQRDLGLTLSHGSAQCHRLHLGASSC